MREYEDVRGAYASLAGLLAENAPVPEDVQDATERLTALTVTWMKPRTYLFPGYENYRRTDVPISAKACGTPAGKPQNEPALTRSSLPIP